MIRRFPVLLAGLLCAVSARANGLLIPADASIPPLALVRHEVKTTLVEQVATTEVTQVFRNHTSRPLEATFVFPVPSGASVNRFSMWVDGKEVKGELVEADKARQIYTDIVRRTQDPGLLEYIGSNLLKVRVFPVPPSGDQKLAIRFTSVCNCDSGLIEYVYPLRTAEKAAEALEMFSLDVAIESQRKVHNVYSPTHAVVVSPKGDNKTKVHFEAKKAKLDRDLKLYFCLGKGDVGLTTLTHRPETGKDGTFMMLISPRAELSRKQHVARDMVFVLDQSGSMAGKKMEQAKKALKHCLGRLHSNDRFAVSAFATTVQREHESLRQASSEAVAQAKTWIDELEPTGGTAIDSALDDALSLRTKENGRPFTVVFFTDGQPTVGEQDPEKIIKNVETKNSTGTRIFTFGVGDDVNAALLDRLAEMTRSASAYVRPEEDIETKVSSLYGKISHPVMTELKLSVKGSGVPTTRTYGGEYTIKTVSYSDNTSNIQLCEVYPRQLPDLFHGGQLVVCGKFKGKGHAALTLTGKVDGETREMVYDIDFPEKTGNEKAFVENLWARRKVGYLLDQIRANGDKKELVDEVTKLAKKHGITTPYTSYLVVPDNVAVNLPAIAPAPVTVDPARTPADYSLGRSHGSVQPRSAMTRSTSAPATKTPVAGNYAPQGGGSIVTGPIQWAVPSAGIPSPVVPTSAPVPTAEAPAAIYRFFERGGSVEPAAKLTAPLPQAGKEGVELALQLKGLRDESAPTESRMAEVQGRKCRNTGGAWIDETLKPGVKLVAVKAMSEAYFKLLAKHPELKDVFRLGNRLVWMTPSGAALVIDTAGGCDKMSDAEIEALFKK